jgi:hypothetical protein
VELPVVHAAADEQGIAFLLYLQHLGSAMYAQVQQVT